MEAESRDRGHGGYEGCMRGKGWWGCDGGEGR